MIHIEPASTLNARGLQQYVGEYLRGCRSLRELDTELARMGEVIGTISDPMLANLYGSLALTLAEFDHGDLDEEEMRIEMSRLLLPMVVLGPPIRQETAAAGVGAVFMTPRRLGPSPAAGTQFATVLASAGCR